MEIARYRDAKCLPLFLHCAHADEKQSAHTPFVCMKGIEACKKFGIKQNKAWNFFFLKI